MLTCESWQAMAAAHRANAETELADIIWRRDRGLKHPIDDFLFHYYNLKPSHLMQWHPGIGVEVEDDGSWKPPYYRSRDGVASFDAATFLEKRHATVRNAAHLLEAARDKQPKFGCFGMHEWAMVYGLEQHQTRHPYLPLRFPPEEIMQIVESVGCRCSHFDAFRFFTPQAVPLNCVTPTRERQAAFDQPGCLHVNMDLYRWAGKLWPAVSSSLLFATFQLARNIRVVDMRASAYDLREWGYEPIRVETSQGRHEYADLQRQFAQQAATLRNDLITVTHSLGVAASTAEPNLQP